jgi:hypothetical protein
MAANTNVGENKYTHTIFFNVLHLDPSHCISNVHIFISSVKYNYLQYSLTCFGPLGHPQRQRRCY